MSPEVRPQIKYNYLYQLTLQIHQLTGIGSQNVYEIYEESGIKGCHAAIHLPTGECR